MKSFKKITYKEMKLRQRNDLESGRIVNTTYRNVSTIFAYFFVRVGMPPNAITISNYFIGIVGFIFLSLGTYISFIVGMSFFILYKIMDDTDGEVARAQNKSSLEGLYFEGLQDYIYFCCLGFGLGIGLFNLYKSDIYLYLGFLLTFIFIIGYAMTSLLKSTFRKGLIDKKIKINVSDKVLQQNLSGRIEKGESWGNRNIFLRLFGIHPAGLFFTFEFIGPILVILTIVEYLLSISYNFSLTIYGQAIGILSMYLLAFFIIKLIRMLAFIPKLWSKRPITDYLKEF